MASPSVPHIKSAARKLPIKRKSPTQQPPFLIAPKSEPYTAAAADEVDDEFDGRYDNEEEEEEEEDEDDDLKPPPPFKFHRIWSEPDEIRFLQGLLGCFSQGLVFPRDLNLFYDRFSESMPQPYTRSQLSEKLRRLRKKFRIMSARIARGQDPARLAPHDRDLLHLCTRLWDPAHAATSPFSSAPEGSAPVGNKRRRPNPRPPSARPSSSALPAADVTLTIAGDGNPAADTVPVVFEEEDEKKPLALLTSPPTSRADAGAAKAGSGIMLAKTVLGVFDGVLDEMRATLLCGGVVQTENNKGAVQTENSEEGVFQSENNEGAVQPEGSEGTVMPENIEGLVMQENIEGADQLEGREGVVQLENKEGAVQPENSEVAFQLEYKEGAVQPENQEVAVQPENNAGAVLWENREEAVQPENSEGVVQPEISVSSASTGKDFTRRWQEQRLAELGVLASRLRLVIEDSIQG